MGNFLLGFGLGITVGVLFAPRSGQEIRGMIGSKATDSVDFVKRQSQELKDTAMDAVEKGKDAVNRQVEKIASSPENAAHVYQR
jgi:gas vesicle protein